ncbi:MAG TPA: hypothetical protein VJX67_02485 [Blastocatellia bacterium]|nr:hypothetical protein [Blastocatellia bacterium]
MARAKSRLLVRGRLIHHSVETERQSVVVVLLERLFEFVVATRRQTRLRASSA